jgi:hopanoid C-2 methylase
MRGAGSKGSEQGENCVRCPLPVKNVRRVLCVFPRYTPSFGTFQHAYKLMRGVQAFMPPQGLLLIAAYMPESWPVRFIDENMANATAEDLDWADVVLVSGMHVQGQQIRDIHRRARAAGKVVVLGGPSVSSSPEMYPEIEYLHQGELGDATDALIARLDDSVAPPSAQMRFRTRERLPMTEFPIPAYHLVPLRRYLMCTLQFSSGCPYLCEFCDIPGLYGRQPRLKSPQQLIAELDAMRSQRGHPPVVYIVDDNFIGNRKAAKDMLPHLVAWQKQHGFPMQFVCEATLNIAKQPDILKLMREASFLGLFVGIETPEADALKAMRKDQNNAVPMMESIRTLNSYGLEVTSGIILGLDTDSDDTETRLKDFIDISNIPVLTINLLQALPKTPLWDRLQKANRIDADPGRESNVQFLRPYDEVVAMWRRCIAHANDPERLFERFLYQVDHTYAHRIIPPAKGRLNWSNVSGAAIMAYRIAVHVGWKSDYRKAFWRAVRHALRRGQIDAALGMGFVAHHLIEFTREALRGEQNASYYSAKTRMTMDPAPELHDMAELRRSA